MAVFRVITQIVEDEKFQKEETDDQDDRGDHDVLADGDIIDAMDYARDDDAQPEPLDAFQTGISLPSESLLPERQVP